MRKAFYITSFNDPSSCENLMEQLSTVQGIEQHAKFLNDQSTSDAIPEYERLCARYGYYRVPQPNLGATASKRQIVEHAVENGFDFISQISEDFELTTDSNKHPAFVSGHRTFLKDAILLLYQVQELPFVHWTIVRGKEAVGYLPAGATPRGTSLRKLHGMTLQYVEGDVALWNWPYSGRAQEILQIWKRGAALVPGCETHVEFCSWGGGEWRQQWVSQGRGACLLAHPVRHLPERNKPEGSLP